MTKPTKKHHLPPRPKLTKEQTKENDRWYKEWMENKPKDYKGGMPLSPIELEFNAKRLLNMGQSEDEMARITGLSVEHIRTLKTQKGLSGR